MSGSKISAAAAHCNNNNNSNNNNNIVDSNNNIVNNNGSNNNNTNITNNINNTNITNNINNNDTLNIHELNYHKNIQSKFPSHPSSPSNPLNNSTKTNSRISSENFNSLNIRILENGQKCLNEDINGNLAHLSSKIGLNKENEFGRYDSNNNNDNSDNNCFSDLDEKPCFSDLSICENRERKKNNLLIDLILVQNILNQNKCRVAEAHLYASLLNNNTIIVPNRNKIFDTEIEFIIDTENPFLNDKLNDNKIDQNINKNNNNNDNVKIEKNGYDNN